MKLLKFYGYSDDTFGEYAVTNEDVDNCANGTPIQCRLDSSKGSMFVIGQYARNNNPCWDIAIGQADEDVPIPHWPMQFTAEGYSTVLEIGVPDDTTLTWFNNMEEVTR